MLVGTTHRLLSNPGDVSPFCSFSLPHVVDPTAFRCSGIIVSLDYYTVVNYGDIFSSRLKLHMRIKFYFGIAAGDWSESTQSVEFFAVNFEDWIGDRLRLSVNAPLDHLVAAIINQTYLSVLLRCPFERNKATVHFFYILELYFQGQYNRRFGSIALC